MKEHILRLSWPHGRYGVHVSDIMAQKLLEWLPIITCLIGAVDPLNIQRCTFWD
jgi:hypothetical protein